jgi:hypothetical protein
MIIAAPLKSKASKGLTISFPVLAAAGSKSTNNYDFNFD